MLYDPCGKTTSGSSALQNEAAALTEHLGLEAVVRSSSIKRSTPSPSLPRGSCALSNHDVPYPDRSFETPGRSPAVIELKRIHRHSPSFAGSCAGTLALEACAQAATLRKDSRESRGTLVQ